MARGLSIMMYITLKFVKNNSLLERWQKDRIAQANNFILMIAKELIKILEKNPKAEVLISPEEIKQDPYGKNLWQRVDKIEIPLFWSREQGREHECQLPLLIHTRNF